MTILSDVEAAATGQWWKLAIKALPYAVIVALAIALAVTRGTLHDVRMADKVTAAEAVAAKAKQEAANAESQKQAAENYAAKIQSIQPVILHNKEVIHDYAQTPAGSAPCLSSDRVSGINSTRAELFPKASGTGNSTVSADDSSK